MKHVQFKGFEEDDEMGKLSFRLRSYFSPHYLWAAQHFSELAGFLENDHKGQSRFNLKHRVYVVNSILSSVTFLEAAINELFQDAHDNHQSYIQKVDKQILDKMSAKWEGTENDNKKYLRILEKYQTALIFAGKDKFLEGENPYQDANLVIRLRNYLTHYKPQFLGEENKHELEEKLRRKFPLNKLLEHSGNPDFPYKMLSKGCAEWSFHSVKNFADEFFKIMDIEPNYQKIDMDKLVANT